MSPIADGGKHYRRYFVIQVNVASDCHLIHYFIWGLMHTRSSSLLLVAYLEICDVLFYIILRMGFYKIKLKYNISSSKILCAIGIKKIVYMLFY